MMLTIVPDGPFSLRESALFGFGQRHHDTFDGAMRLAFCLDGTYEPIGVVVRQDDAGAVGVDVQHLEQAVGPPQPAGAGQGRGEPRADVPSEAGPEATRPDPPEPRLVTVRRQVSRMLSLDHDAAPFVALGDRDPVLARLLGVAPGLRPPLFHNPYEALSWAVLSARRPAAAMQSVRRRLSEERGTPMVLAGQPVAAFPTPTQLLAVDAVAGLDAEKVRRLHGVAQAALDGTLDADDLRALEPAHAAARLQTLRGVGPFTAALVVVRALGHTDVLPTQEPRLLALVGELYGLGAPATPAQLERIAAPWQPFRTWACVLVRAASSRLAVAA